MNFATFLLGVIGGLIANHLSRPFSHAVTKALSWTFHVLDPHRFDLSGTWEHSFEEPDPGSSSGKHKETECLRLNHLGNMVSGSGETKADKRNFTYDLQVTHNLVFGSYKKVGEKGNITGSGMIQLVVSPDRLVMAGQATWFDRDTEKIESTPIRLLKIS